LRDISNHFLCQYVVQFLLGGSQTWGNSVGFWGVKSSCTVHLLLQGEYVEYSITTLQCKYFCNVTIIHITTLGYITRRLS